MHDSHERAFRNPLIVSRHERKWFADTDIAARAMYSSKQEASDVRASMLSQACSAQVCAVCVCSINTRPGIHPFASPPQTLCRLCDAHWRARLLVYVRARGLRHDTMRPPRVSLPRSTRCRRRLLADATSCHQHVRVCMCVYTASPDVAHTTGMTPAHQLERYLSSLARCGGTRTRHQLASRM